MTQREERKADPWDAPHDFVESAIRSGTCVCGRHQDHVTSRGLLIHRMASEFDRLYQLLKDTFERD